MSIAIQPDHDEATVVVVELDVPRPDNWMGQSSSNITPAMVSVMVQRAIKAGWPRHMPMKLASFAP